MQPLEQLASPPKARLTFRVGIVGHRPNRLPSEPEALAVLRGMVRSILAEARITALAFSAADAAKPASRRLYSGKPPLLRAISPLAEGSDRMFAEEALSLGYELCCPMPFAQEEFERDFGPPNALEENSVARFRDIQAKARSGPGLVTFELDGERNSAAASENEAQAYGTAGRVVLNQCDLLVVVWDGGKAAGGGGTVQTLEEALHYHVPVLWIDALAPQSWQRLQGEADLACLEGTERCVPKGTVATSPAEQDRLIAEVMARIVNDEIGLPAGGPTEEEPKPSVSLAAFFSERKPALNPAFVWKLFRDAVGSNALNMPKISVPGFIGQIRGEWPILADPEFGPDVADGSASPSRKPPPPSALADWANRKLRPHYAWSDKLADLYADAYRSAYLLSYLLAAIAVFMALLPMAAGWHGTADAKMWEIVCVSVEFVILAVILLLLVAGSRRRWHERWMEYRLLAELIRQIRFLIPLGGGRPLPHVPAYLTSWGDPSQSWMYWQMRAVARETGIPSAKVTPDYVRDCLDYLAEVVVGDEGGQLRFHRKTAARSERIHRRLHLASLSLFALTLLGITLHLLLEFFGPLAPEMIEPVDRWLVLLAATLPALGAALAGIKNHGEFTRVAKRSAAMADGFEKFSGKIAALRNAGADGRPARLPDLIPLVSEIADVMVQEVVDWRVMFFDRRQSAA